jgi:hypothetical protein
MRLSGRAVTIEKIAVNATREQSRESVMRGQERQSGPLPILDQRLQLRAGLRVLPIPDLPHKPGSLVNPETIENPGVSQIRGLPQILETLHMVEIQGQAGIPASECRLLDVMWLARHVPGRLEWPETMVAKRDFVQTKSLRVAKQMNTFCLKKV